MHSLLVVASAAILLLIVCGASGYQRDEDKGLIFKRDKLVPFYKESAVDYGKRSRKDFDCPVIEAIERKANDRLKELQDNKKTDHKSLRNEHLPFEYSLDPSTENDIIILYQDGFVNWYSMSRKTPVFTAQRLNGSALTEKKLPAREKLKCFRNDTRLNTTTTAAFLDDYRGKGFDRGHVTPFADMIEEEAAINTFQLSNMVPQYHKHNSKPWSNWEEYTREKAKKKSTLFVITGATAPAKYHTIGKSKVVVPGAMYKVLVWCDKDKLHAEYIFTEHKDTVKPSTNWGSTEGKLTKYSYTREKLSAVFDVENFIKEKANIEFKISKSNLCKGTEKILPELDEIKETHLKMQAFSAASSCQKSKDMLYRLSRMGKLNVSRGCIKSSKNVLDLGMRSFSVSCKKDSNNVIQSLNDDTMIFDQLRMNTSEQAALRCSTLIGNVKPGEKIQLLDFLRLHRTKTLSPLTMPLRKIGINCSPSKYHIDFYSVPLKFRIVPKVISFRDAVFSLRLGNSKDGKIAIAGVTGQWAIGNILVDVLARYDTNTRMVLLRGVSRKKLTIDLENELDSLTGSYVPIPLPSVSLSDISVTAQIDLIKGGLATVLINGSIGKSRVHAIFQKPVKAGKFSGAFAAEFGPFKLSALIKKAIEVDISSVPFFGSLTIPRLGVTISSNRITSSLLPTVFCKEGLLKNTLVTIPKGLQVFYDLRLGGNTIPLKMYYYKSYLSFQVVNNGHLSIGTLLSAIPGVNIRSLPLPPGIRDIFRFQIDLFSLDTSTRELTLDIKYPGTLRYFNGYLTITKPYTEYHCYSQKTEKSTS